jgi:hypothetical protein
MEVDPPAIVVVVISALRAGVGLQQPSIFSASDIGADWAVRGQRGDVAILPKNSPSCLRTPSNCGVSGQSLAADAKSFVRNTLPISSLTSKTLRDFPRNLLIPHDQGGGVPRRVRVDANLRSHRAPEITALHIRPIQSRSVRLSG